MHVHLYELAALALIDEWEPGTKVYVPPSPAGEYVVLTTRLLPNTYIAICDLAARMNIQPSRAIAAAVAYYIENKAGVDHDNKIESLKLNEKPAKSA